MDDILPLKKMYISINRLRLIFSTTFSLKNFNCGKGNAIKDKNHNTKG
jgi:hypothetical protein